MTPPKDPHDPTGPALAAQGTGRRLATVVTLLLLVPLAGALVGAVLLWRLERDSSATAAQVNVSGRQRMYAAQLATWAAMVIAGQDEDRAGLQALTAAFEQALGVLEHGGELDGRQVQPLPSLAQPALVAQRAMWERARVALLALATRPRDSVEFQEAAVASDGALGGLRATADAVTSAVEQQSARVQQRMHLVFAGVAVLNLALFLLGMRLARRHLLVPVNAELAAHVRFLREVFDAIPGVVIVFERGGRIESANQAVRGLLDLAPDALSGQPVSQLFASGAAPSFEEIEAGRAGTGAVRVEQTLRTKDGAPVPVLFSATTLHRPGGDDRAVCVALDLRERKKLEAQLREAQKLESVGRLAAGVAHEINTPVQFITDSLRFLEEAFTDLSGLVASYQELHGRALDPAARAEAARAEERAELDYLKDNVPDALARSLSGLTRIADLVRSMREFAQPGGRDMAPVNLNQAIENTLTIAHNQCKYVAEVETDLGELPPVTCHAGDVSQAVLHVLVNAAQATGEVAKATGKRGLIRVGTRREGDRVVIAISDSGHGIPEQIRDKVCDPFFTTREVGQGKGQGLALARLIVVERHGGELSIESAVGQGTTVLLSLPVNGDQAPVRGAA